MSSRLRYLVFLVFFSLYVVSPLKVSADISCEDLQQEQDYVLIQIAIIENILDSLNETQQSAGLFSSADSDLEFMVKKKRAVLRSFTLILALLMAIAAHTAATVFHNLTIISSRLPRLFTLSAGAWAADVYASPHSGLAPPRITA